MTRSSDDTTWPAATPTWVHWIQARKAFEPGSGAYPGRVVYAGDGTVLVERIPEHTTTELVIARP
ncbi:MAG: hypothetical protein H0U86_07875, partial [Chloroflexi bacterium]|nr:hypothetical protein [Chloroflexota bacterium]